MNREGQFVIGYIEPGQFGNGIAEEVVKVHWWKGEQRWGADMAMTEMKLSDLPHQIRTEWRARPRLDEALFVEQPPPGLYGVFSGNTRGRAGRRRYEQFNTRRCCALSSL